MNGSYSISMLKNYFKIGLRNLIKNRSHLIINTLGMGVALSCCITAYILVAFNFEFDDFHEDEKVENIYRLHAHVKAQGFQQGQVIGAPNSVGPTAARDFSGIRRFMRYAALQSGVSYVNRASGTINSFSENIVFADSTLFDMFEFPLVSGNNEAFREMHSVFLDEDKAIKYFGESDPIGEVLNMSFKGGIEKQFIVAGIIKKIPYNTSMNLPIVLRFEVFEEVRGSSFNQWTDWMIPATYFELENPNQRDHLAKLFDQFIPIRNQSYRQEEIQQYVLEPFKTPIVPSEVTWSFLNYPIDLKGVMIFVALAIMILLVACFNLANTTIAMIASRLKEIGLRKALGAQRKQIVFQFLIETFAIVFLSLVVAWPISKVIVPEFSSMWNILYGMADLNTLILVFAMFLVVFIVSFLSGLVPASLSSQVTAVSLLKSGAKIKGAGGLTRSLVSLQFTISLIVLIAGLVFIQNARYLENIDFGYEKRNLLLINIQEENEYRMLKAQSASIPDIQAMGTTEHNLGFDTYTYPISYLNKEYDVRHVQFGENYFETMNFNFVSGGPIDYEKISEHSSVVVNRQFVKMLEIEGDPIGQQVSVYGTTYKIKGVIEDLVDKITKSNTPDPIIFYVAVPERWRQIVVRADESDLIQVNNQLEKSWKELFPTKPYISNYQEELLLGAMASVNRNLKNVFLFLTILGALLSIAGIYSLASLSVAKRGKEIGIRKTLGASVVNLISLLNREFYVIMIIAIGLGLLSGYFGVTSLLDMIYPDHIPVTPLTLSLSALIIAVIGVIAPTLITWRASRTNPVEILRHE